MNKATFEQIAAAFTEWERRWRYNPALFQKEQERLALSEDDYGLICAPYFLEILGEIQRGETF